jgi:hypothetical protein|tara:strand:+ start:181 stop:669 length:489 start_codon:yes stop_codon:yes gene_type:complete
MSITADRLRAVLRYEKESGQFYWIAPPWNHTNLIGQRAGCNATGYILIRIDGRKYKAHRLAWLYVKGVWPKSRLDHRDGQTTNNRIDNLREATPAQNCANSRRRSGKVIAKGVRRLPSGKFQARIRHENKLQTIGTFQTEDQAAQAYFARARAFYGEFARAA